MSLDSPPRVRSGLQHAAGFHDSVDHLLAQVVPMVDECLARDEPMLLVLTPTTAAALREIVGEPRGLLLGEHPNGPLGSCGQSLAVHRAEQLGELSGDGPVTAIVEHDSGSTARTAASGPSSTPPPGWRWSTCRSG